MNTGTREKMIGLDDASLLATELHSVLEAAADAEGNDKLQHPLYCAARRLSEELMKTIEVINNGQ